MRVGFIGLGSMGGPMASHIIAAGHRVAVHDLRQEAAQSQLEHGAKWADSPKAVAAASEMTFTSLPGSAEVEAVALGGVDTCTGRPPTPSISISRPARRRSFERFTPPTKSKTSMSLMPLSVVGRSALKLPH